MFTCVWPGVVLMEHNSSPIGQSCKFLGDWFLQMVQLLKDVQIEFGSWSFGFSANPTFIAKTFLTVNPVMATVCAGSPLLTISLDVVVSDLLFITNNHPIRFMSFFCVNSCGTHTSIFISYAGKRFLNNI